MLQLWEQFTIRKQLKAAQISALDAELLLFSRQEIWQTTLYYLEVALLVSLHWFSTQCSQAVLFLARPLCYPLQ